MLGSLREFDDLAWSMFQIGRKKPGVRSTRLSPDFLHTFFDSGEREKAWAFFSLRSEQ